MSMLVLSVVVASGCKVYKRDLLDQRRAPDAGAVVRDAAADSGGPDAAIVTDSGSPPVTHFDPDNCLWGDCWWSTGSTDGCRSAGVPLPSDRPAGGDATARVNDIYLGFTDLRLGSSNNDGKTADDAWMQFGFDLDGLCTNSATCQGEDQQSCKPGGSAIPFDGQLCRDNTFAKLQPVIAAVPELGERFGLSEEAFNCELWRGGWNNIVRISGYNGELNDSLVRVDFYQSAGIQETLTFACPETGFKDKRPRWLPSRKWSVVKDQLAGSITTPGTLPDSKTADPDAYVRDGYLVARIPDDAQQGFAGTNTSYRGFRFNTQKAVYVGRLVKAQDGTWNIQDGVTSGRIRKTDLEHSFREIGFCETGDLATFYASMQTYVDENSDLLASGVNDAAMPCDAMSYAFGFHAAQLTPGTEVDAPKLIECCAPGKTLEECSAVCGDGMRTGGEKCDTMIAAGMPGACPTKCEPTDSCTPTTLMGTGCGAGCEPMPITMTGAADGCCPAGANATTDRDCKPVCGNSVIETGETCDPKESCKPCKSDNACLPLRTSGSADTCNIKCDPAPITQCRAGDNCCPSMCTSTNDRDCSANCGNGRLDNGETCEANTPTPCAANCDDGKACTKDVATGSPNNCNLVCAHTDITQATNNDGCCPSGASANNDSDCSAMCGNKAVEGDEQCDDGNTAAGDGCAACKNETPQQICLAKIGASDACAMCTCNKCAPQANSCYAANNANDVMLCDAMVDCGKMSGCGNPNCYCGSADLFLCLTGIANGPCKNQVSGAAKTSSLLDIQARSTDTNYPLGRANAISDCVKANCATECGR